MNNSKVREILPASPGHVITNSLLSLNRMVVDRTKAILICYYLFGRHSERLGIKAYEFCRNCVAAYIAFTTPRI